MQDNDIERREGIDKKWKKEGETNLVQMPGPIWKKVDGGEKCKVKPNG